MLQYYKFDNLYSFCYISSFLISLARSIVLTRNVILKKLGVPQVFVLSPFAFSNVEKTATP